MPYFVKMLSMMCSNNAHPDTLENAIRDAFDQKGHAANMEDVLEALKVRGGKGIAISFMPYGDPNGKFYKYFNGPSSVDIKNNFSLFLYDEDAFEPKNDLTYYALLLELKRFIQKDKKRKKHFYIDNYWVHKRSREIHTLLLDIASIAKEHNTSFGIRYQSFDDIQIYTAEELLFQSAWKLSYKYPYKEECRSIHRDYFDFEMQKNDNHKFTRGGSFHANFRDMMVTKREKTSMITQILRIRKVKEV